MLFTQPNAVILSAAQRSRRICGCLCRCFERARLVGQGFNPDIKSAPAIEKQMSRSPLASRGGPDAGRPPGSPWTRRRPSGERPESKACPPWRRSAVVLGVALVDGSSKDRDFAVNAFRVVEQAISEHMDGSPLEDPHAGKNAAAVALGKLGGTKGGKARAAKLTPARRKAIAKKAAKTRWNRNS